MENIANILIVDDDQALLQALPQMLYLRMKGVQVDTADSALPALDRIQEHDYDAIVSDIKMPGMDGLELLTRIHELRPDAPVLLITGHGEHDLAIRALRGGAYDYILKPIDRDTFAAALQRAIQAHQLRRQVLVQHIALGQHAKALETMVQKRTHELVEANATKDKFLSIVAHELKTPLSNLESIAQVLSRQIEQADSVEAVKQGLVNMEHALKRTRVLVQDLLDTSLIETNMFVLHRKRCNLVELCRQLLNEYTAGAGPELTSEFTSDPIEAEVDEGRISQVLINLLSNARKYSRKGSPITVALQQSGYETMISVRDMGVGIPSEALPHIFEQFYRVPGIEPQNGERAGTGLGLYISRKIVERHGGRIEVQSTPGSGSSFTVILPIYVDPQQENAEAVPASPHTQALWTMTH
ncbi:MAG: hybrid sensor histidine kinase/response regulator [Chloroflexota bacterium]|nr:hybrid sensor histidine kinase/response regulator [Chloroflexota bacterium]